MLRFIRRRNVKIFLGLAVAVLLLAELVNVVVLVGTDGVTKMHSATDSKRNDKVWTFQKSWSNGLDGDSGIREMGDDELQSDVGEEGPENETRTFGKKDGKGEEEDPREMKAEMTEEEELKFLEKLLSRDNVVVPDVDKLTGSEKDGGNPEEERVEKEQEDEAEKQEMKYLEKMLNSHDDDEDAAEIKQKKSEQEGDRPVPHDRNTSHAQNGGPVKHAAIKTAVETKSESREIKGLERRKEKLIVREHETDGKPEVNEEGDGGRRKDQRIRKTSIPINEANDPIHVDASRPVVNPHPFRFIVSATDVCKGTKVLLFCYVHSAVQNNKRRARIRRTWGNRKNHPDVEMRVVFFVGQPPLDTPEGQRIQERLLVESGKHGDIVQEDFLDARRNLSHKGVGALKWVATYCNDTAYVLKTDDDMFVNMYVIVNHLRNLYAENYRRRLIMCYVFWLMHVDRKGGQWSLPRDYFPDDLYPPYCSGMGFVASGDVAIAMYNVSPYVPFLWVDDAFISGVLPAALQGAVNHTSWARTYCAAFEMGVYTHPTEWYKYTFSHVHNETLNLMTWRGLTEIVRNRTIPRPSVIRPGYLADEYIPLHTLFSSP